MTKPNKKQRLSLYKLALQRMRENKELGTGGLGICFILEKELGEFIGTNGYLYEVPKLLPELYKRKTTPPSFISWFLGRKKRMAALRGAVKDLENI